MLCHFGIFWVYTLILLLNIHCKVKIVYYIWKAIGDKTKGFKVRINQHIADCKTGVSTCKFPRHGYDIGIKNNCLEKTFFSLNIMLRLNKSD